VPTQELAGGALEGMGPDQCVRRHRPSPPWPASPSAPSPFLDAVGPP
jgi:hypothetical protein